MLEDSPMFAPIDPCEVEHELRALYEWAGGNGLYGRTFQWLGRPCGMDLRGLALEGDGFCQAVAIEITG